ncbi:IS3 family transposase, partial [Corynebacterium belfantii]|uniref:IS3 family transposase n=1 Tax=Corynebacterium belfantii TaxID=2014537 RepID=UPI00399CC76A
MVHRISSDSHNTYGYRRIWWQLRHLGITISEKVVRSSGMKTTVDQVRRSRRNFSLITGIFHLPLRKPHRNCFFAH